MLDNKNKHGFPIFLILLLTIGLSLVFAIIFWKWIEPESFWGILLFIALWGIVSKILHLVLMAFAAIFVK